jgi:competence ComEA-like helix-hairpin-helix protein
VIDVNNATEEELMTLTGINRHTARNIVDYRRRIGGFRKVEDVALVSGVGASRLAAIRSELCVRRPTLRQLQPTMERSRGGGGGIDDDVSADRSMSSSGIFADDSQSTVAVVVDVNTASTVELLQVPLIDRTLADRIVQHRQQYGSFTDVDDLLAVEGLTPSVLTVLRPHLLTQAPIQLAAHQPDLDDDVLARDLVTQFRLLFGDVNRMTFYRRYVTNPAPPLTEGGLRLATWNLDHCNSPKIDNPGVKEVVAMTILENRLSLIALQGITDHCVLLKLCCELNEPTLGAVKRWTGPKGIWKYVIASDLDKNYVGVIYNCEEGIEVQTMDISDSLFPINVVHIAVHSLELILVNVFVPPDSQLSTNSFLSKLKAALNDFSPRNVVFVGNIHCASNLLESVTAPLTPVFDSSTSSNHSNNIWLSRSLYSNCNSGKSGMISEGLTSPWIPNGWQWGGMASKYQPAWLDLSY